MVEAKGQEVMSNLLGNGAEPREFWLNSDEHCEDPTCWKCFIAKQADPKAIHVIEYTAYERSQAELGAAKQDALNAWRVIQNDEGGAVLLELREQLAKAEADHAKHLDHMAYCFAKEQDVRLRAEKQLTALKERAGRLVGALDKLTVRMNPATAAWRHRQYVDPGLMDKLCNAQIDAEKALAEWEAGE